MKDECDAFRHNLFIFNINISTMCIIYVICHIFQCILYLLYFSIKKIK